MFEPWLEGCLPAQMMKASFFGSSVPFCVLQVVGAEAGIQDGV